MNDDAQGDHRQGQVHRHGAAGANQSVIERVKQVVNAADPANAKPSHQAALLTINQSPKPTAFIDPEAKKLMAGGGSQ